MTDQEVREAAPTGDAARNTSLDLIRGIAVLGILVMNAVSFGLADAAYDNISVDGMDTWLDWVVGVAGEIFVDQKFMGLFSALFGAGIVLFADRAEAKGRRPVALSLWRNFLLLIIGLLHTLLWEGDVLVVYALASPFLIMMRRLRPRTLFTIGGLAVLTSPVLAVLAQSGVGPDGAGLGSLWGVDGPMSDDVELFTLADYFLRAVGLMLIGVGLYRTDVITGKRSRDFYRRLAVWGLGIGIPVAGAGVALVAAADFAPSVALVGLIPNTLATIPIVLGYIGLIVLWNMAARSALKVRLEAAGRMALTNYLTQTVLGVSILTVLLADVDLTRSMIAVFVVGVWVLQLWWSKAWLDRFRFGPAEWLWRCATYRRWQPLRRSTSA